jgi:hypothetical protein
MEHMGFRNLRIAFSAVGLFACELLIVFWVASYNDSLGGSNHIAKTSGMTVEAFRGQIGLTLSSSIPWKPKIVWDTNQTARSKNKSVGTFGFALSQTPVGDIFIFPFWLPVFLTLAVAAAPWIHWAKRFSLRTLLIATTLIAVVLGVIISST